MKSKDSSRVQVVGGQAHFALRVNREIFASTHVYDTTLLTPFQDATWNL